MFRKRQVLLSIAAAVAVGGALTGPAAATYPGDVGRLAFAMNGADGNIDIYTALPNGSSQKRLTTDPGFDACAAYSADGQQIASAAIGRARSRSGRWTRVAMASTR